MIGATLVIEHAPHRQTVAARDVSVGRIVIGRSADSDWQIDDPDMYLSRKHCTIAEVDGVLTLTDSSRGGVFVDGASTPLGAGNTVILENGMRLRMGDFVFRVDMKAAGAPEAASKAASAQGGFRFAAADPPPPEPVGRKGDLPDPFDPFGERSPRGDDGPGGGSGRPPLPLDRDDPFALDGDAATPRRAAAATASAADIPARKPAGSGYFDDAPLITPTKADTDPADSAPAEAGSDIWGDPSARTQARAEGRTAERPPDRAPERITERQPPQRPVDPPVATVPDAALRAAFFRGLGIDPARHPAPDPEAAMEELGEQFRALVDGVMRLLRARAVQKQNVRVAQTLIASADVNPLKFLATTEDALSALVTPRGSGYLDPRPAIDGAFRDLADHQIRSFAGVQAALRRMIDGFDPETLERELADAGLLETLLGGGRSALLWQLYRDRYREIATAAEERFLGELGATFREGYEHERER